MATTIQISSELQTELAKRKIFTRETYEDVIWDLIDDTKELSKETKKSIEKARDDIKKGKFYTLDQVKEELGL